MKGDIFHILNRGVEKRKIFITEEDYLRFSYNLRDFNNKNNIVFSYSNRIKASSMPFGGATSESSVKPEERLVNILCCCLMPNHFHLLVQENLDKGASKFAQKITGGYTMHFNLKNDRSGVLFQGRSKIISITKDAHFVYLPYYIFSNPVELIEPGWKEKGIKDLNGVNKFLENYKYSNFSDIVGKNKFLFIINKDLFYNFFNIGKKSFQENFTQWLKNYHYGGGDWFDKFES